MTTPPRARVYNYPPPMNFSKWPMTAGSYVYLSAKLIFQELALECSTTAKGDGGPNQSCDSKAKQNHGLLVIMRGHRRRR